MEFYSALLDAIAKNPDAAAPVIIGTLGGLIGTALGAIFATIGVLLTNRHNTALQKVQLSAEAAENLRERQMALKRDVYLPAAEAFIGMVAGLSKLLRLEIPDDEANDRAQPFAASLARIQIIASPPTISRAANQQRAFLETIAAMFQHRIPMKVRQSKIDAITLEANSIQEQMQQHNRDVARAMRIKPEDQGALFELFRHGQILNAAYIEARVDELRARVQQQDAIVKMFRDFVKHMENLVLIQGPLLACIRVELEGDEALQLITAELKKTNEVGVRVVTDVIPNLERAADELRSELASFEDELAKVSK